MHDIFDCLELFYDKTAKTLSKTGMTKVGYEQSGWNGNIANFGREDPDTVSRGSAGRIYKLCKDIQGYVNHINTEDVSHTP